MKINIRRIFSLVLSVALVLCLLPAGLIGASAENGGEANVPTVFTAEDYALIDALFEKIEAMENAPAKKNSTQTQLTDAAEAIVLASDNYLEGSLDRNGDFFSWMTDEGIRCCYNPRMRKIRKEMNAPETPEPSGAFNEPIFTKGGWPTSSEVYLIAPYYGIDESFTDQYKNEAEDIAESIGDTSGYTLYSGSAATVDKVADAVSNGAVVIFDSHGSTDYYNPDNELDYVTGATSSYLCLSTMDGLTDEDYADGAMYSMEGDAFVNGAVIANHMSKNSPAGLLWMAICLGMATDTMCEPLRAKGVEVVYGYSQSVTFGGDYLFEEVFWDNMCEGATVAESIADMKATWGNWDWSVKIASYYDYDDGITNISEAREYYAAFPIVVSDEDVHPGQRNNSSFYGADSLQTVKSTYTIFSQYAISATSSNTDHGTVSVSGNVISASPKAGYYASGYTVVDGTATVVQSGNVFRVTAESDCEIRIEFAARTPATVTFRENGVVGTTINTYMGDEITLPDAAKAPPSGHKFLGWVTESVKDATEKPALLPAGSTQIVVNTTYYALYSYSVGGSGSGDYEKVTKTPDDWSGEYLIVYETGSRVFDGSLSTLDAVNNYKAVTITNGIISADAADAYKFTIAAVNGNYTIKSASGKYIGQTSNSNGLESGSTEYTNSLSLGADGNVNIISSGGAYLRYNPSSGQDRFRYYKSSTYNNQKAIALYVKSAGGATYYTTSTCAHANTESIAAKPATCIENGNTAGLFCEDCETVISGNEPIAALGHHYEATVTPPTATEQGYTTHVCSECGHSYIDSYVPSLNDSFTISFRVPAGVSTVSAVIGKGTVTLPGLAENKVTIGETVYTFVGWTTAKHEDSTVAPAFYAAGSSYNLQANITLYALFTYDVSEIITVPGGSSPAQNIAFNLGTNGSQSHVDGNEKSSYSETSDGYELSITSGVKMYTTARDAKGNSCIKLGTSKAIGSFSMTVPDDVTAVIFSVAQYKANATKILVNGTQYTISTSSDSGSYTDITVDTSSKKTISFATVGNNYRCMINTITYVIPGSETPPTEQEQIMPHYITAINPAQLEGATLSLGETLGLHFHTTVKDEYVDDTAVEFTYFDDRLNDYVTVTVSADDEACTVQNGMYLFTVQLPAVHMATDIEAVLMADGEVVQTMTYSVRDYAMAIINGNYAQKYKDVATAMLNYGATAQQYFNYRTDELANDDLEVDKFSDTETALSEIVDIAQYTAIIENRPNNFMGFTLLLKDVTIVRLYFSEEVAVSINGTEKTAVKDDNKNLYYVQLDGVNAANLDAANTIVCGDMTIHNLSVLSLASLVAQDTEKSEEFREAMCALILYAQSVNKL